MASSLFLLDATLVAVGLYIIRQYLVSKKRSSLPPGPKGLPLIGNVLDMPTSYEWLAIAEWTKQWGTIPSPNHGLQIANNSGL